MVSKRLKKSDFAEPFEFLKDFVPYTPRHTITISSETKLKLKALKKPHESYDDVIDRLFKSFLNG